MSHTRDIIINSMTPALQDPEVREHWTTEQTAKVDQILNAGADNCSDDDFRRLTRRLNQAFCTAD